MIADHHNRYDFGEWNIFAVVVLLMCLGVGILLKKLLDYENKK